MRQKSHRQREDHGRAQRDDRVYEDGDEHHRRADRVEVEEHHGIGHREFGANRKEQNQKDDQKQHAGARKECGAESNQVGKEHKDEQDR